MSVFAVRIVQDGGEISWGKAVAVFADSGCHMYICTTVCTSAHQGPRIILGVLTVQVCSVLRLTWPVLTQGGKDVHMGYNPEHRRIQPYTPCICRGYTGKILKCLWLSFEVTRRLGILCLTERWLDGFLMQSYGCHRPSELLLSTTPSQELRGKGARPMGFEPSSILFIPEVLIQLGVQEETNLLALHLQF